MKNTFMNINMDKINPKLLTKFMDKYNVHDEYDAKYLYIMVYQRIASGQKDRKIYFWSNKNKVGYIID